MTFGADDEQAYHLRREELTGQFAEWAGRECPEAEPVDVELLLDWKWGYGDGRLDHWDTADVEEFLLGWCPRKVAAPPDLVGSIPHSVGAYVAFLADEGLLAPSCSPSAVQRACADLRPRFHDAMADPTNFGMAKSLFGGFDEAGPEALLEHLARLTGTSPDTVVGLLDDAAPVRVGPVRAPTEDEVAAAIADAPMFTQVRGLVARCAPPGLALTAKGNLRRADARRLVVELETGDQAGTLGSAAELPQLGWLVATALAAGAVRRLRGRLVGVARFAEHADRDAYERIVRAGLAAGVDLAVVLLAALFHAGDDGGSVDDIAERIVPTRDAPAPLAAILGTGEVERQIYRLAALGLLTCDGKTAALTAAGRAVGAEIVGEAGVEVVYRADPTAPAEALVSSMLLLDEDDAAADLAAWAAAHPSGAAELTAAALRADLGAGAVLSLLEMAGSVVGADVERAVEAHRDGPRGPLVTMWLLLRGAIDAESVEPDQMLIGTIDVAAAMMDDAGPDGVVEFFGADVDQTVDVLDHLWRAEHERTVEVLDALGSHHPDRRIAKAARRSLMKARSRG